MKTVLGIEFGSTRIKAVAIDEKHIPVSSGDYTWASTYENGIWTYDIALVHEGMCTCYARLAADYNLDGKVTASDARKILRKSANLE